MQHLRLHRNYWKIPTARATVILFHGHGEYSSRYDYTAKKLNAAGYAVVSGDLPGNGRSPGLRGHIDRFEIYFDIVDSWIKEVLESEHGDKPIFLLGHSGGGLIVTRYLETLQTSNRPIHVRGAVLSSPVLRLKMPVPIWKAILGRTLNLLWPRLRMATGLRELNVSRSSDATKANSEDTLMVHVASVRYYNELLRNQKAVMREAHTIGIPMLVMHGGADAIASPEASLEFVEQLGTPDKQFRLWPNLLHEILNEPERNAVISEMLEWLDHHLIATH